MAGAGCFDRLLAHGGFLSPLNVPGPLSFLLNSNPIIYIAYDRIDHARAFIITSQINKGDEMTRRCSLWVVVDASSIQGGQQLAR